jgi:adenylate cyclase
VGIEIERKFLVAGEPWRGASSSIRMLQGYITADAERSVRVRIAGDQAWLTLKGRSEGPRRLELEYAIPVEDARSMLAGMCDGRLVEKVRHSLDVAGIEWVVDVFEGRNAGLVVAEIECADEIGLESAVANRPAWATTDVTEDPRFYNSSLAERPFLDWSDAERARC